MVHRSGDPQKMLQELHDQIFIDPIVGRDLDADLEHVLAEERHPRGAVGLFEMAAAGQRRRAIEYTDVVETQEAALENIFPEAVLTIDPPGKVGDQLSEGALHELDVSFAAQRLLHSIKKDRGPGVHRRIYVAEVPFISRDLPLRV